MEASDLRIGNYVWRTNKHTSDKMLIQLTASCILDISSNGEKSSFIYEPTLLTEELVKRLCYFNELVKDWGKREVNEWEYFNRYVFYNVLDGTSNLEIHAIHSKYGDSNNLEFCLSIDENERQGCEEIKYLHQLQNGVHFLTNQELEIK
tara:strand:- start:1591 stop:2037 length:447 start_codon:yes stop_codon:yes gene_type:complete